jgi:predicted Zn-dependent protease
MKARFLLIPAILATTGAIADTSSTFSDRTDAQARAAALLSRPHRPVIANSLSNPPPAESIKGDAHARAAALLSPQRTEGATTPVPVAREMVVHVDAHEHAAALLSGSRISREARQRAQQTRVGAPASGQTF